MDEKSLRDAVRDAVLWRGVQVLSSPRTLMGILADSLPPESVELGVLFHQCDDQWLSIYAEAVQIGTPEALYDAAGRAELVLVSQRATVPEVAKTVCAGMAYGIADALGIDVGTPAEMPVEAPVEAPAEAHVEATAGATAEVPQVTAETNDSGIPRRPPEAESIGFVSLEPQRQSPSEGVLSEVKRLWRTASTRGRALMAAVPVAAIVGTWIVASMTFGLSSCVAVLNSALSLNQDSGGGYRSGAGYTDESDAEVDGAASGTSVEFSPDDATKVRVIAIAAGGEGTVGLLSDGRIVATGETDFEAERRVNDVSEWKNMTAVSRGETFILGLRVTNKVSTMGSNEAGQCNLGEWTDVASVAGGGEHTVAALTNGTVKAAGSNANGQCDVGDWKDVASVAAGTAHTLGLKFDGTVVATGRNDHEECAVKEWTNVVEVAAGAHHSVARLIDGRVVAVGSNEYGQCDVDEWTNIVAVAADDNHTVALCADGTVVATGDNSAGQCNVSTWKDVVAIAAGNKHTVGLCADGTLLAMGSDEYGQLDMEGWNTDAHT